MNWRKYNKGAIVMWVLLVWATIYTIVGAKAGTNTMLTFRDIFPMFACALYLGHKIDRLCKEVRVNATK